MSDASYPMTIGQLSVWRDVLKKAPERRWEANLPFVWDIPPGHSEDEIWAALTALAMRHESLRTTYFEDPVTGPRQRLATTDPAVAMATVRQPTVAASQLHVLQTERIQEEFDWAKDMPWRAWILTTNGVPTQLFVMISHIAADGAASLIMQDDFGALLEGRPLPPAPTTREMAQRQHEGEGANRLRTAERYWRRTFEAAPRRPRSAEPDAFVGAILHTGVPLPMAHEAAARLEVSLSSVLLAAYYRAARRLTGRDLVLLFPMSFNRFDAESAALVTSLNQWVPLLLEFDADEPLDSMVKKVHWKAFNAFKNGTCDPDAIVAIRTEFEALDPPIDPGFNFNAILAPPGFPAPEEPPAPPRFEWYDLDRTSGPGFYLIARAISSISIVCRIRWPAMTKPILEDFLMSMRDTLVEAVGLEQLSAAATTPPG